MSVQDPLADRFPNQRKQQPPEGVFSSVREVQRKEARQKKGTGMFKKWIL